MLSVDSFTLQCRAEQLQQRPYDTQSLKCLLPGSSQGKSADPAPELAISLVVYLSDTVSHVADIGRSFISFIPSSHICPLLMLRKKHFQIPVFTTLMYLDSKWVEVEVRVVFKTSSLLLMSVVCLLPTISMVNHISSLQGMVRGCHGEPCAV